MDIYVARQPILNRKKKLFAYELLFRGGTDNAFPDIDGDIATSQLLSTSFLNFDIEHLAGNKLAFINFTEKLLIEQLPTLFPKEKIMVEILEDVLPKPEVLQAIKDIRSHGYKIALDDFEYHPDLEPLIDLCHLIKVDFTLTTLQEAKKLIERLSGRHIKFLAEKVETYDEFQAALDMGFDYFQGYFFSRPEVLGNQSMKSSNITMLQLIREAHKDDYSIDKIENLMNIDVNISYKLLRYINSASFCRNNEITSIRHAICYLGMKESRRFISLIALSEICSNKPGELVLSAIVRARFCELLANLSSSNIDKDELFIVGIFSHIDAMLDTDMESLMDQLPLAREIKEALIHNEGILATYLNLTISYEAGNWENCLKLINVLKLDAALIPDCYIESLEWANNFTAI